MFDQDFSDEKISDKLSSHGSDKNDQSAPKEESDEEAPLLFVDVNLGPNDQRRIVVYEGDDARVLAQQFCTENDLDQDTQDKLEQLLIQQIASVLQKIDEDEDQEESSERQE